MSKKYYFVGFMGTGKTTISKQICKETGLGWIDTDQEIVEIEGRSINDIFKADGEDYFRRVETETLRTIGESAEDLVVSCGGGLVLKEENIHIMQESGQVIWLSASPETIFEHVRYAKNRPLLNGHMNVDYIRELLEKRLDFYRKAATITIETDGKKLPEITDEILKNVINL